MDTPQYRAICLNGVTPANVTFAPFALAVGTDTALILKDLEGYANDFPSDYNLETELAGIVRVANDAAWHRFHLVGYSGGASVALAFASAHPDRVASLPLIEPPFVGNDVSWSDEYAALLRSLDEALVSPLANRPAAFFRALTGPGRPSPPAATGPPPEWLLPRSERQGYMWPRWRDVERGPNRLAPVSQAAYLAVGGRTHPGLLAVAKWIARYLPKTTLDIYPERSHLDPPHVAEPRRFVSAVKLTWDRSVVDLQSST